MKVEMQLDAWWQLLHTDKLASLAIADTSSGLHQESQKTPSSHAPCVGMRWSFFSVD